MWRDNLCIQYAHTDWNAWGKCGLQGTADQCAHLFGSPLQLQPAGLPVRPQLPRRHSAYSAPSSRCPPPVRFDSSEHNENKETCRPHSRHRAEGNRRSSPPCHVQRAVQYGDFLCAQQVGTTTASTARGLYCHSQRGWFAVQYSHLTTSGTLSYPSGYLRTLTASQHAHTNARRIKC
jgi:hypothetical protein